MTGKKNKSLKITLIVIASLLVIIGIAIGIYLGTYYRAQNVENYLTSSEVVTVTQEGGICYFDGPGEDTAFIFYPGAKVEYTAYAPIMYKLAEEGIDCFIVKMPGNLAMLGKDKASDIIGNYNYNEWYIGGHSLGGYVATTYANEHRSEVTGVILLAAFAMDDMSDSSLKILSIYGDKDGILSMEKIENGRELMPSTYEEVVIEGGNHSQMGSYGFQKDDNSATITLEQQHDAVVNNILAFVKG